MPDHSLGRSLQMALLPMPFSIHSIGMKYVGAANRQITKEIKNSFVEIVWSVSGVGEVKLYDRVYQLRENDVFYYLPNEDHEMSAVSETWTCRWICFDGPLAEAVMLAYRYPRFLPDCGPCPEELFKRIEKGVVESDPMQVRILAGLLLELLARIGAGSTHEFHSGQIVKRCVEFVKSNLSNPDLNLPMLCENLGVHRSTLTERFQKHFGIPPGRYILNMRFTQAKTLLLGTALPISEIAERCGFSELSSFSRFIRRATGLSPLNFRNAHFGENKAPSVE